MAQKKKAKKGKGGSTQARPQTDKSTTKTPDKKVVAKKDSTSMISKMETIIKNAGKKGIGALQAGQKLGLIKEDMDPGDRSVALKQVRTLCRRAAGGAATKRNGRTAVYIHSTNV